MNESTQTLAPGNGDGGAALAEPKVSPSSRYEPCEHCGAPLDHRQRYCVNCAARRPDPSNPASRYFAAASRKPRSGPVRPAQGPQAVRGAAVMLLILLPIAVGIGVLVGRSGQSQDNSDLLAALKDQGAGLAAGGTDLASDTSGPIPSSFGLEEGYTVKLQTLPASGTDAAAVSSAESDAESQGAKDVGVISPKDFKVAPDQGGDYVIYSGEFEQKGDAEKALGDLKADFKDAEVIKVTANGAGGDSGVGGSSDQAGNPTTQLVKHTQYGDVHKVTGIETSDQAGQEGMQIAQDQANRTGGDYIDSQRDLPDVIQVGN